MEKKTAGKLLTFMGMVKAPKLTYLLRHPLKGTRNLLAFRGAKSLLKTRGAKVTAATLATVAAATPLALKVFSSDSEA